MFDCDPGVCYLENKSLITYFKCIKFHSVCTKCFNKLIDLKKEATCPVCNAELCNEARSPETLTKAELLKINPAKIILKHIYFHQMFEFNLRYNILRIFNGREVELEFYIINGVLASYDGMFISTNGFLYSYDENYQKYHLAIKRNKYQFWDMSKIIRIT